MKTATMVNRSVFLAGVTATLAVAALSFAGSVHASGNVYWSVGLGAPGVSVNVGNFGQGYWPAQPVYIESEPVYYEPRPVFVSPAPIYVLPQPVYYGRPHRWNRRHDRQHIEVSRPGYGAGYYDRSYAPVSQVIYPRDGWGDGRRDGRRDGRHENRR